jgi:transcriptional regulator with XRE-family HTH domain
MSLSLGRRIVDYRKKAGISQKELAEMVGIKPSSLSYYERGKREPNVLILIGLAKALRITGDALLGVEPQPDLIAQNSDEAAVLRDFRSMNQLGQKRALENMSDLSEIPKYSNNANADDRGWRPAAGCRPCSVSREQP